MAPNQTGRPDQPGPDQPGPDQAGLPRRRRLGVALLFDEPLSGELDGLRRALGDPGLGRIPPHITLVPPVNVRAADLASALSAVRAAATAQGGPIHLTIGSVRSFLPVNPVLYLAVGGQLELLRRLRDDAFRTPLERKLSWPWVPHVTLGDGIDPTTIEAALAAMAGFAAVAAIDRIVLLEEGRGREWTPLADASLGPAARVGTGGLAVQMTAGRVVGPDLPIPARPSPLLSPIVVTAEREGASVGGARAWADHEGAHVSVYVVPEHRGQGIGGHLLTRLEALARGEGWAFRTLEAEGPWGFYEARSRWSVSRRRPRSTSTAS